MKVNVGGFGVLIYVYVADSLLFVHVDICLPMCWICINYCLWM